MHCQVLPTRFQCRHGQDPCRAGTLSRLRAIRLSRVACLIARRTIRGLGLHGRRPWHLVRRLPRPAPQPRGGWEPVSRDHAMRSVSRARAILQCTEKLNNCSLLLQQRCMECRGETVRDVVGKVMPDLRYDIKGGRFLPCTLATVAATRAPRSSRGWQTACRDHEPEGARGSARARAGAGRACRGRNAWGMP